MKRQMILGTDWWTDCDDAVALRLLAGAHQRGEVSLLGICLNACMPDSLCSCEGFVRAYGIEGLPFALDREATDFTGRLSNYQHHLTETAPSRFSGNEEAEEPVAFYRRLLAGAEDKVEIAEIGFPQVLAALLASAPDRFSPLTGRELVEKKVSRLWMMAGKWSVDGGREHNFENNARSRHGAAALLDEWPTPITFLGFEVGESVITGSRLPEGDLLRQVLVDHGSKNGRCSWDPMLVLLALTADPAAAGYDVRVGTASVDPEDGANHFRLHCDGRHSFVVKTKPDAWYADAIDSLLVPPSESRKKA